MARMTLEQLMKKRAKRTSAFEQKQMNLAHIQMALIEYLEHLPIFKGKEIIDIDVEGLTNPVNVKIYYKE